MSTKQTFEKIARNTWLAGLGSIETSIEVLNKSIDTAQEKSNKMYNDFVHRGEEVQNKIFEATEDMETRGRKLFGYTSDQSQEEKLAQLTAKVEQLTEVVDKLLAEREGTTSEVEVAPKPTRRARPKRAVKATKTETETAAKKEEK